MQWQMYRYIETNAHIDAKVRWTPPMIKQDENFEVSSDFQFYHGKFYDIPPMIEQEENFKVSSDFQI